MAALDPLKSRVMEFVAAFVIVGFTAMMAFITVAPYFHLVVGAGVDTAIISQHQTTIQNISLAIIGYLFGASVGTQKKDASINTLVNTNASAQAALSPVIPEVTIPAGDTLSVKAGDDSYP